MPNLFKDRWTLVTGASSGFGDQFARQLAAKGSNLIVTARSTGKLEALAEELRAKSGVEVREISEDLAAPGGAKALCEKVDALDLEVEHLMNNAGYGLLGAFIENDAETEAQQVRLNCEALAVLSRHFLPAMAQRGRGGVIHVASVAGMQPSPYFATYSATKAFVISLSLALSEEMRPHGVRVLALCPGYVATGFQQAAGYPGFSAVERMTEVPAPEVVRQAIAAYEKGRDVHIPGALNRAGAVTMKLLPQRLLAKGVGRMMRQTLARGGGRA